MYLGIDIGASYCKAAIIDSEEKIVRSQRVEMPSFLKSNSNSYLTCEVKVQKIETSVIELLDLILRDMQDPVEAIGLAGQMHGILIVDESNKPLSNFISWQDQRTAGEKIFGEKISYLDYLKDKLTHFRTVTGTDLRPGMLGPIIFWFKKLGYIDKKCAKVSFLSDYIASRLSDTEPVCDPTNAAGSGIFNLIDNDWLESFFDVTKISKEYLPKVVKSGTVVGGLSSNFAARLGLKKGLPIYASVGDYQAALFASGINTDSISLNIGTGAQVSVLAKKPLFGEAFETRPFFNNFYTNCISGLPGGRCIALFESFLKNAINLFAESEPQTDVLNRLDEICATRLLKTDLICAPNFFTSKAFYGNAFYNINSRNFKVEDLYFALLDGAVYEYHLAFNRLNGIDDRKYSHIILSGGVGQKSKTIQNIVKKYFMDNLIIPKYNEEAAAGAGLLAKKYNYSRKN